MAPPSAYLPELPPLPSDLVLPPLPRISDAKLEKLVFTHSSYHAKPRKASSLEYEVGEEVEDNEKLEHVGDAWLGLVVTDLLKRLFPNLRPGPATTLKAHLVSNNTLSQLSIRYSLPSRLLAERSQLRSLQTSTKPTANIFEAYIAAIAYSTSATSTAQSLLDLQEWLIPLFTPIAHWALEHMRAEAIAKAGAGGEEDGVDDLAAGSTALLNGYFKRPSDGRVGYEYHSVGLAWECVCTVELGDGRRFTAEATRAGKKAAMTVAAYKVCQLAGIGV